MFTYDGNDITGDCTTNGNIPYFQVNLATGKCDAMIYPLRANESIKLHLEGQTKVVAKSVFDNRNQEIFHSGTVANDWYMNQYRAKKMDSDTTSQIYNNRTSQLYNVTAYDFDGQYRQCVLGNDYVIAGHGENVNLWIKAQEDMFVVIFNLGSRILDSAMQLVDEVYTWYSNITIEYVYAFVEGVFEYVIPRVSALVGQYLVNLLGYYLWTPIVDYVNNNAVGGQLNYFNSIHTAQPIIEEVDDALIPIQN